MSNTDTTAKLEPMDAPTEARPVNSVDATAHQPIVDRVTARKEELERLLEAVPADDPSHNDITLALSTIDPLLTGDLAHVPAVVAADMNRWLERNKHVGESAVRGAAPSD